MPPDAHRSLRAAAEDDEALTGLAITWGPSRSRVPISRGKHRGVSPLLPNLMVIFRSWSNRLT